MSKVMQNWNSELRQIKAGGRKKILQACIKGGVRVCEGTIKSIAREAKLQEEESERYFLKTGEFKGINIGFTPIIVTQPPNSPDLNINDLGFFASLKVDVKRICTHCTSRQEMMVNVMKAFEEYPKEKIDGIWASWYNNLRSVMSCDGGNDYKQAHNGGKKRKRETGSAIDLTVNLVDYDRCVRLCR